jgi:orotidine-5'-phosphate decarboxylase
MDQLVERIKQKNSCVVVGLDTDPRRLPDEIIRAGRRVDAVLNRQLAEAQLEFNRIIVDAVYDKVPMVKLQIAFYEMLGPSGLDTYKRTIEYARSKELLTIGDIKRGDIGSTAGAYAEAHLASEDSPDAVTVNPYMGSDAILPFLEIARPRGKGLFVLVKTSNPSSSEIQDLEIGSSGERVYEAVARRVAMLGSETVGRNGYGLVGAVVGATYPEDAAKLRKMLPHTYFLVPGFGAQGAGPDDVAGCLDSRGLGAVVNASRSIIFAYEKSKNVPATIESIGEAACEAAETMRKEIDAAFARRRARFP